MPQISHSVLHGLDQRFCWIPAGCSGHNSRELALNHQLPGTLSGRLPLRRASAPGRASALGRHRPALKIPRGGLQAEAVAVGELALWGEPMTPSGLTCQGYIAW